LSDPSGSLLGRERL